MPDSRLYHDLLTIKVPQDVDLVNLKPLWQIMTDEKTGMKFSVFHKARLELKEHL